MQQAFKRRPLLGRGQGAGGVDNGEAKVNRIGAEYLSGGGGMSLVGSRGGRVRRFTPACKKSQNDILLSMHPQQSSQTVVKCKQGEYEDHGG